MNDLICKAFLATRDGYSPDRVVVDPLLNRLFQKECVLINVTIAVPAINNRLLNARKAGLLKGIKTIERTSFSGEDDYRYASEIAVRFLET